MDLHSSNSQHSSNLPCADIPWLSVIIPTFNGEKFIAAALSGIVAQQYNSELEVLVVDDGSTDNTLEIINSYASILPIRILASTAQKNWVANTNLAMRQARGQFISLLHQDDFWLPDRLACLRKLSQEFSQAVLLLHPSYFVNSLGKQIGQWNCPFSGGNELLSPEYIFRRLVVQNFIAIPAPIFRREALAVVGEMNEALWFTADWEYWLRFSQAGPWAYCSRALSCFRIHPQSLTIQGSRDIGDYRKQHALVLDTFLPQLPYGDPLKKIAQFSCEVNCQLAESFHGRKLNLWKLAKSAAELGPIGFCQYFSYSRILERVIPRLRSAIDTSSHKTIEAS